jgi:hypothetical protein
MSSTLGWSTPANVSSCSLHRGVILGGVQIATNGGPNFNIIAYEGSKVPGECVRDRDEPALSQLAWDLGPGACGKLGGLSTSTVNLNWNDAGAQGAAQIGYKATPTATDLTFQPAPAFQAANQCLTKNWQGGANGVGATATMPGPQAEIVWAGDDAAAFFA